MTDGGLQRRWFAFTCGYVLGAVLSLTESVRVFLLKPREFGTPRGAAEDWFLLALVLLALGWTASRAQDVAMVGRIAIVVFSIGFAMLSFQEVLESYGSQAPRYIDDSHGALRRSNLASVGTGAIFAAVGIGISRWRRWARALTLIVCVVLSLGCAAYVASGGLSGKVLIALMLLAAVIIWLYIPDVRRRFQASGA
jgi:hypothetical protein